MMAPTFYYFDEQTFLGVLYSGPIYQFAFPGPGPFEYDPNPKPRILTPCQQARQTLAVDGALNVGIGAAKVAEGFKLTGETGGLAIAGGAYLVFSGTIANGGAGGSQLLGAATGRVQEFEELGEMFAGLGTFSGWVTFAASKGDIHRAAMASRVEGLVLAPFLAGAGGSPGLGEFLESGNSAREIIRRQGSNPCSQN